MHSSPLRPMLFLRKVPATPAFPHAATGLAPLKAAAEKLGKVDFTNLWAGQADPGAGGGGAGAVEPMAGCDRAARGCGAKPPSAIRRTEFCRERPYIMSVDAATVRRIAHLARIAVAESEVPHLQGELNAMLAFVEQLSEVNVEGVEPMTSVIPMEMKKRPDVVNDGEIADDIVRNAAETQDHFFLVPKVVE